MAHKFFSKVFPISLLIIITSAKFGYTQSLHQIINTTNVSTLVERGSEIKLNVPNKFIANNIFTQSELELSYILTNLSENILDTKSHVRDGGAKDEKVVWDIFEAPYEIRKNFPYYHSGYDEDSRPIWVIEFGKMNTRKVIDEGGEKLFMLKKYTEQAIYFMAKSILDRSTPDQPVTECIVIGDMDQLNILQVAHYPTMAFALDLSRKYKTLLQRHMYLALVVNTNAVAHTLLNVVKPVFGRIFEKIEVFGTNKAKYIPQILKHCPKNQIPSWYGGSADYQPIKVYG